MHCGIIYQDAAALKWLRVDVHVQALIYKNKCSMLILLKDTSYHFDLLPPFKSSLPISLHDISLCFLAETEDLSNDILTSITLNISIETHKNSDFKLKKNTS